HFLVEAAELRDFEPLWLLQQVLGDDCVVRPRLEAADDVTVAAIDSDGAAAVKPLVAEEALVGWRAELRLVRVRRVGERPDGRLKGGHLTVRPFGEQSRRAEE